MSLRVIDNIRDVNMCERAGERKEEREKKKKKSGEGKDGKGGGNSLLCVTLTPFTCTPSLLMYLLRAQSASTKSLDL